MHPPPDAHTDASASLRRAVAAARTHPELPAEVAAIYADLAAATLARKPRCDASGRCCDFDAFQHRLYVTTAELAVFIPQAPPPPIPRGLPILTGRCVFQVDGLCSVHDIRPFGCRVFFCDPTAGDWVTAQYELHHARLRSLHDRLGLEYHYAEWRWALTALTADPSPA